jgi:hypothetical protein
MKNLEKTSSSLDLVNFMRQFNLEQVHKTADFVKQHKPDVWEHVIEFYNLVNEKTFKKLQPIN